MFLQIIEKDPLQPNGPPQTTLVEIGPRFVLTPIRIFEGAFGGATVFSNPGTFPSIVLLSMTDPDSRVIIGKEFISPSSVRSALRREQGNKYNRRKDAEVESARRKELRKRDEPDLATGKVFAWSLFEVDMGGILRARPCEI